MARSATLLEPRAIHFGGYSGVSIRIARGVSTHTGRIVSESHEEWQPATNGALYVTNKVTDKRIIFDGATKNRILKMHDIFSVRPEHRAACLNLQSSLKPVAFGAVNGQILAAIIESLRGGGARNLQAGCGD